VRVKDEIEHILFHVDAAVAGARLPNAAARKGKIRSALMPFMADSRALSHRAFLEVLVPATQDVELKTILEGIDKDDDGQKIRLILAAWVRGEDRG